MKYTITCSKRRTIALYVRNGTVEVRTPMKAAKRDIDKFVESKKDWIAKRLEEYGEQQEQRESFTLNYGDTVTYCGTQCPIVAKVGNRMGFDNERNTFYMPPNLNTEQIKYTCVQIYRMLAKRDLTNKVIDFAKIMKVTPLAVKVNGAKSRWGSCSNLRSLNFSWRLIMADDDVIDYVVVHELAHITEMNHSARFWAIVESVLPDYRERQERLKELQRRLNNEDWEYNPEKDIPVDGVEEERPSYAACDTISTPKAAVPEKEVEPPDHEQLTLF